MIINNSNDSHNFLVPIWIKFYKLQQLTTKYINELGVVKHAKLPLGRDADTPAEE